MTSLPPAHIFILYIYHRLFLHIVSAFEQANKNPLAYNILHEYTFNWNNIYIFYLYKREEKCAQQAF